MVGRLLAALALLGLHGPLAAADLLLESRLEPCRVQAQCRYTLVFWQAVDATETRFVPPAPALAEIEADGPLRQREAVREGRRYRVLEQDYRLYAYASGPLKLSGARVESLVPAPGGRRKTGVLAADLVAKVQPLPAIPPGQSWLPAESLTLEAEWLGSLSSRRPGQALERRFRLEARGIAAARLPALAPRGGDFSLYPGPEQRSERRQGGVTIATLTQTFTYVPRAAGELQVPAVELAWWQERQGGWQWARVAGEKLRVVPLAGPAAPALPPGPNLDPAPAASVPRGTWFGAGGLLLALLGWAGYRLRYGAWPRRWALTRALTRAFAAGDPIRVRDQLLLPAQGWLRPPASLQALATRLDDAELTALLLAVERACYGPPGAGLPDFPTAIRRRLGAALGRLGRQEKKKGRRALH